MHRRISLPSIYLLAALWTGPYAVAQNAVAQKASAALKTAAIQGTVTNSLTGEPVARAHVKLVPVSHSYSTIYGAITTINGHFSMAMIPPGSYTFQTERRGFLPLDELLSHMQVDLKADEDLKDVQLKMLPGAVISGRVLDNKGRPVALTPVKVMGASSSAAGLSNDLGEFRFAGLYPGAYLVKAFRETTSQPPEIRSDGTAEVNYGDTYYPGSLAASNAVPLQAQAGQETSQINIKLKEIPAVRVSGTVAGTPPGATGTSILVGTDRGGPGTVVEQGQHFTVWRLNPGPHWVMAECYFAGRAMQSAPAPIQVAGTNIDNISLTMLAPFDLRGHADVEQPSSAKDQDASRGTIGLVPVAYFLYDEDAPVDVKGDFKFTGLSPSRYLVRAKGFPENVYVRDAEVGPIRMEHGILDLSNGAPSSQLTVTLATDGGKITGKLLGPEDVPATGNVSLFALGPDGYVPLDSVAVGEDGVYNFNNVAPGKYRLLPLELGSPEIAPTEIFALFRELVKDVELDAGQTVSQDLQVKMSQR